MKNTQVKTQVRIQAMLPRVEDLEHSVQWTSLANDIDRLKRSISHQEPARRFREPIERHAYQRAAVPEMQRASPVDDNSNDAPRSNLTADYPEGGSRWSWRPRTDFEREYFYKDYKDYYRLAGDPAKCLEPVSHLESSRQPQDCGCSREGRSHPSESPAASGRYSGGLDKEHFSDSRERLHEIFEYNRYLRRQFFASNARQDCGGFPRPLAAGRSHQEAPKRYNGFGSTETLTSQSNQSSVSSINERKLRWGQTSRSPEEEEEDALAVRNNVPLHGKLNVRDARIDRQDDGGSQDAAKVLVNILPGSEVRHVDVRSVKLDQAKRSSGSSLVEEEGSPVVATNAANCAAWRRERNLPEYIFGESTRIDDFKGENSPDGRHRDATLSEFRRRLHETRPISEDKRMVSANVSRTNALVGRKVRWDLSRSLPNLTISKRNLEAPLYVARAVNVPEEESVESPDPPGYELDAHVAKARLDLEQRREDDGAGRREKEETRDRTRFISCEQSISEATDERMVSPKHSTPRKVKAPSIPPLDLTTANERYELTMADERKCLDDYSVDVAVLCEDLVRDLLATAEYEEVNVVKDDTLSKIGSRGLQMGQVYDKKKRSFRPLHKSCGDLSLADELQSPQLVNNCKSSTRDLRTVDPAVARRPIDPDASRHDRSPLFDQTGPTGRLYTGSALPSVYGPIPYSQ